MFASRINQRPRRSDKGNLILHIAQEKLARQVDSLTAESLHVWSSIHVLGRYTPPFSLNTSLLATSICICIYCLLRAFLYASRQLGRGPSMGKRLLLMPPGGMGAENILGQSPRDDEAGVGAPDSWLLGDAVCRVSLVISIDWNSGIGMPSCHTG